MRIDGLARFRPLLTLASLLTLLGLAAPLRADTPVPWRDYVTACLDTLIDRGTDVYGPEKTPLLMSVIDVRTMDSGIPQNGKKTEKRLDTARGGVE